MQLLRRIVQELLWRKIVFETCSTEANGHHLNLKKCTKKEHVPVDERIKQQLKEKSVK